MVFNNKVYDVLKWVAMYFLPALGTLYFGIASVWGLPYAEQILGTISAVDAFLGVVLGISSACYQGQGKLIVNPEGKDDEIEMEPEYYDLADGDKVVLKVERGS